MDDYVAAVTVAVAAYRRRKQIIKNTNQSALVLGLLDEEDAIVSRDKSVAFATCVVQQFTSSVHIIRCRWRPLAKYCWHGLEDHVLYHATVVSRYRKVMCLPAAAVLRLVLWAKACPGRTDAKVEI